MYDEFYQEKLPCGGTLKVNKSRWEIEYYYPGPDNRHRGEFFSIYSNDIDNFIQSLINNFMKYIELQGKIPSGGEYNETGEKDMTIAVGRYLRGVSLYRLNDFIATEQSLKSRLDSFEYAKERAIPIQQCLNQL
jgi:hypothetical protein